MNNLLHVNSSIKKEADDILYKTGLFDILNLFGQPVIHGSYELDLMTWRDLDIYLRTDSLSETDFFVLGSKICTVFKPIKMNFRNEMIAKTSGLPVGLYWGVYLGNERAGAWKIDIWAVNSIECERLLEYYKKIKQRLTTDTISYILEIKSECWKDPDYRRTYSSTDIYTAVLKDGITNINEFKNYLSVIKPKE